MHKNRVRIWLLCSMLLALGLAPFLARGDQEVEQQLDHHRQTIARMSPSERERLDRNFKAYQQMSPEKIASINAFHTSLESDSSGDLKVALDLYEEWLTTIEPHQRDQLKETVDPLQRIQLIREIRKGQRQREATAAMRSMPNYRWRGTPLDRTPTLRPDELARIMEKIESIENHKLSDENRSELNRNEGLSRYLILIKFLKQNTRIREQDRSKIPPHVVPELFQTFEALTPFLREKGENETVKNYLTDGKEWNGKDITTLRVQGILIKSMIEQAIANRKQSKIPNQAEIESYFNSLDEETQNSLMELEGIDFYTALNTQINPKEDPESIDLRTIWETFYPNRGDSRRPGDRGRSGGPRGERSPGEGGPRGQGSENGDPELRGRGERSQGDRGPRLRGPLDRGDGPLPFREGSRPPRNDDSTEGFSPRPDDSAARSQSPSTEDKQ